MSLFVTFPEGPEEVILSMSAVPSRYRANQVAGVNVLAAATEGKKIKLYGIYVVDF